MEKPIMNVKAISATKLRGSAIASRIKEFKALTVGQKI